MYVGILLFLSVTVASAALAELACDELNSRWSKTYAADFHYDEKVETFEYPSRLSHLVEAIDILYATDPDHAFYAMSKKLTTRLTLGKGCDDDTAALMRPNGELLICEKFDELDSEKRAATIFHESSHARSDDPGHVKCDRGDAKGKFACDQEFSTGYSDGSGYNWEVRYLWHRKHSSAAGEMARWTAAAHLRFLLLNRFNRITGSQLRKWLN